MRRSLLLVLTAALMAGCPSETPTATKPTPKRGPATSGASTAPSTAPSTAASASAQPASSASPDGSASPSPSASASAPPTLVTPMVIGLRNGGHGLPARRLSVDQVTELLAETDGGLLISRLGRLQRINKEGLLEVVSGDPYGAPDSLEGLTLRNTALTPPRVRARESAGRWLLMEPARLSRVELDGKLTQLWPTESGSAIAGTAPLPNGEVLVLIRRGQTSDPTYDVWTVKPDKTRQKLHTFTGDDEAVLDGLISPGFFPTITQDAVASDGQGGMLLWIGARKTGATLYRFAPDTKTLTRLPDPPAHAVALDGTGNLYLYTAEAKKLELRKPDGTLTTLTTKLPDGFNPLSASVAADGTAYVVDSPTGIFDHQRVLRIKNGEVEDMVGPDGVLPAKLDEVDLDPDGLAVAPNGTLYVSDFSQRRILKVVPGQPVTLFGGKAEGPAPADGLKAEAVSLVARAMRLDKAGNLYLIHDKTPGDQVLKIASDGTITVLHTIANAADATERDQAIDLAVSPEGQVILLTQRYDKEGAVLGSAILRLEGTGSQSLPVPVKVVGALAIAPDGSLAMVGYETASTSGPTTYTMARWTADKGITKLQTYTREMGLTPGQGLAIAPGGQFIVAGGPKRGTIFAVDPVNGTVQTIVGEGGSHFLGTTRDEGVRGPSYPNFDAAGNLYFSDTFQKQVKAIKAEDL